MFSNSAAALLAPAHQHNQLLALFSQETRQRWAPHLQQVELPARRVLYEARQAPLYAYFPIDSVLAVNNHLPAERSLTIALIGREGLLGVNTFLGHAAGPSTTSVLVAGSAWRLDAAALLAEFQRGGSTQQLLLAYTQSLVTQIAQTAACNRHHTIDQQLSLRLVQIMERVERHDFDFSQSQLADLVGARRERVNQIVGELQAQNAVSLRRGGFEVLDSAPLLRRMCGCHAVMKAAEARVLGNPV